MLTLEDFKKVAEDISTPILIGKLIQRHDLSDDDFDVLFVNSAFSDKTKHIGTEGSLFSSFSAKLSKDMPWAETAEESLKTGLPQEHTFYSILLSCWLRIVMNPTEDKLLIVTVSDVSQDKEHEQQLKRQNLRLAALTDELSLSRENLRAKLDNIETLNSQLQYTAYHDTMTGLENRTKLSEDLAATLSTAEKEETKFGIMLLDIDNMKITNDSQGHSAGDELIMHATQILQRFARNDIKLYRFGGDEFLLLATHIESRNSMITIGDALLESFNADGIEFSAGISIYPDDTTNREELLKYVDMAMYDVKKRGKNNVTFFQSIMREKFMSKLNLQTKLNDALKDNIFQLYFQPQFDIATNTLRGFEALLRWHDDELGWINPEQFIPLAEESRLVIPLGDWVMETSIATLKKWQTKYNFKGIMSVNVSPVQLKKPTFIFDLGDLIEKYGIAPPTLEIEITEGVLIENRDETVQLLNQIRQMGIGISLDDFGTGYSSLSYLQILPITTLKIDKSFIANITSKTGVEANITDSIVSMVTKMGLDTIAEGVEKPEQLQVLHDINCKNIQGFLKGKPMPAERCEAVLAGDTSKLLTILTPDEN